MKKDKDNRIQNFGFDTKNDNNKSDDLQKNILNPKIAKSKKKMKSNKNQKISLMIIALLILLFFILLIIVIIKIPDQPKIALNGENETIAIADYQAIMTFNNNEGKNYYPFDNQFVYLSQNRIQLLNQKNENIYNENLDFNRPVNIQNNEYFLASDRESGKIIVLSHQGKQFSLDLDGVFAGAYFANEKYIAIIEENSNKSGFVHIVSVDDGQVLLTLQFFESGYPLSIVFDKNLEYFDVLLSNTSGSNLQTIINRYDFSGKQLGQIKLTKYPNLYAQIYYDKNENLILAGPGSLLVLDFNKNEVLAEYNVGRIIQMIPGDKIDILVSDRIDDGNFLIEWSESEQKFIENDLTLLSQIDQFAYNDSFIAMSQNNHILLINKSEKSIILDQYIDTDILKMNILNNKLILITDNSIKSISF